MTVQPPTKKRPVLLIVLGILALCCIAVIIFGSLLPETTPSSTDTPAPTSTLPPTLTPAEKYVAEYGGVLASYQEIFDLTDCALLQEKFDIASENNTRETAGTTNFKATLGYMTASDEQMKSIGCYLSIPTATHPPSATSTTIPTATLIVIVPTQPGQAVCSCAGDFYNCTRDFSTHSQAQACFNYCTSQGAGDIHQLDGNGDGLACESLP